MFTDEDGDTDLMEAVFDRNIIEIKRLLEIMTAEEKETLNAEGYTALMLATQHGYLEEMQALIDGHVNIETTDTKLCTALHIAAEQDLPDAIDLLLRNHANIEAQNIDNYTAIMLAARLNHFQAIMACIKTGNIENTDILEVTDGRGCTAIMLAAEEGHAVTVSMLRQDGANLEAQDNRGRTAVMLAAENDKSAVIEALIEEIFIEGMEDGALAANIEAEDEYGYRAIHIAVEEGGMHALRTLLDLSVEIDAQIDEGFTALIIALREEKFAAAQLLLEYGASVNSIESADDDSGENDNSELSDNGVRPLMCAATRGNIHMMKLLIARGADLNYSSQLGEFALLSAITAGQVSAVSLLLASGAELSNGLLSTSVREVIIEYPQIKNLLNTAAMIDFVFTEQGLTKQKEEFISSAEFNMNVATQRFVSLCVMKAKAKAKAVEMANIRQEAKELLREYFNRWLYIIGENAINLSEVIAKLLTRTEYLGSGQAEILGDLFAVSEALYREALGAEYQKREREDDLIILPRKRYLVTRDEEDEYDDVSELSEEIEDERAGSEGDGGDEASSGAESENDSGDNTLTSGHASDGDAQAIQPNNASLELSSKDQEKAEKYVIEANAELNTEFNLWLNAIFAWSYMPKWLQDDIINSAPIQVIIQSIAGKDAIYNPVAIADKFAGQFIIELVDHSLNEAQDDRSEKASPAKTASGLLDTSLIYSAAIGAICILPKIDSGMYGKLPMFEQLLGELGVL